MTVVDHPPIANPAESATVRHCVFRVGSAWYAIDATVIREIAVVPDVVTVPRCHPALAGLCHQRNAWVPVLRLECLLRAAARGDAEVATVLVISDAFGDWALAVDSVAGLERLQTFVSPDGMERTTRLSPIFGTATFKGEVIQVLDTRKLYRLAQTQLDAAWGQDDGETDRALFETAYPGSTR